MWWVYAYWVAEREGMRLVKVGVSGDVATQLRKQFRQWEQVFEKSPFDLPDSRAFRSLASIQNYFSQHQSEDSLSESRLIFAFPAASTQAEAEDYERHLRYLLGPPVQTRAIHELWNASIHISMRAAVGATQYVCASVEYVRQLQRRFADGASLKEVQQNDWITPTDPQMRAAMQTTFWADLLRRNERFVWEARLREETDVQ